MRKNQHTYNSVKFQHSSYLYKHLLNVDVKDNFSLITSCNLQNCFNIELTFKYFQKYTYWSPRFLIIFLILSLLLIVTAVLQFLSVSFKYSIILDRFFRQFLILQPTQNNFNQEGM